MLIFLGREPFHLILVNAATNIILGTIYTAIGAIPSSLIVRWLQNIDDIKAHNQRISYNPFSQKKIRRHHAKI
jgi:hypothetical protein